MRLHCKLTAPDPARAAAALQRLPGVLEVRTRPGALHISYNPRQVRYRELARCLESGGPHAPRRSIRGWLRRRLYEWLEQNFLEHASQPPNWEAALRDTYLRLKLLHPRPRSRTTIPPRQLHPRQLHPRTPTMDRAPSSPGPRIDATQAPGNERSPDARSPHARNPHARSPVTTL